MDWWLIRCSGLAFSSESHVDAMHISVAKKKHSKTPVPTWKSLSNMAYRDNFWLSFFPGNSRYTSPNTRCFSGVGFIPVITLPCWEYVLERKYFNFFSLVFITGVGYSLEGEGFGKIKKKTATGKKRSTKKSWISNQLRTNDDNLFHVPVYAII